jgi:hypothetical protein
MRAAALLLAVSLPLAAHAQTRESGPWWPNREWGAMDQAGASNRITPEKIVAANAVSTDGPRLRDRPGLRARHAHGNTRDFALRLVPAIEPTGSNRVLYNDEFLAAEVGQVGTQFDGLGHIGGEVRFADGSLQRVFYNGFTSAR